MADLDPYKDADVNDLTPEEAAALAYARSNVSLDDFNPDETDHSEHVVELADRSSHIVSDLVDHDDPLIATDAQAVVDGNFPGGPNYPNGPAEDSSPRTSKKADAPKSEAPKSQSAS